MMSRFLSRKVILKGAEFLLCSSPEICENCHQENQRGVKTNRLTSLKLANNCRQTD